MVYSKTLLVFILLKYKLYSSGVVLDRYWAHMGSCQGEIVSEIDFVWIWWAIIMGFTVIVMCTKLLLVIVV